MKKRSYSKKRTYKRKYKPGLFKRVFGKKKSYAKRPLFRKRHRRANMYKMKSRCRVNYVKYMYQATTVGDWDIPASTTNSNSGTVQSIIISGGVNLSSFASADAFVDGYAKMYRKYRIKSINCELTPKFSEVTQSSGTQLGEVWIVPLHQAEEIYRAGAVNVAFGGSPTGAVQTSIDYWSNVKHAHRFTFTKPGVKPSMRIKPSSFQYVLSNPEIGVATPGLYSEKAVFNQWYPTVTYSGTATPTRSAVQHYGFVILFAGFQTNMSDVLSFEFRHWYEVEFKDLNAEFGTQGVPFPMSVPSNPLDQPDYEDVEELKASSDADTDVVDPPYPNRLPRLPLPSPQMHAAFKPPRMSVSREAASKSIHSLPPKV